jgi:hypothetical protein
MAELFSLQATINFCCWDKAIILYMAANSCFAVATVIFRFHLDISYIGASRAPTFLLRIPFLWFISYLSEYIAPQPYARIYRPSFRENKPKTLFFNQ